MNWIKNIGAIVVVVVVSGFFIHATSEERKVQLQSTKKCPIPQNMNFAGEKIPLHISDVRERFDRELLVNAHWHSNTYLVLKRANKVFPVIEPILQKYGVPDDFKYLAVIESGLINAISSADARGIWQFMPTTAKEQGLEINSEIDERYHLKKSTEAACRYLLSAKDKFGSWTLAAAAYNGGTSGITSQINSQKVNNYYDLLLNDETSRYVFRIIAAKEVMSNPEVYGYDLMREELYTNPPLKQVEVNTPITSWTDFAMAQGINYKVLKIQNPWLRDTRLTNSKYKKYILDIPTSGY